MSDLTMVVTVTRTALGLADLQLNDHIAYMVGGESLGRDLSWNRTAATSPYLDGDVTVYRTRQKVMTPLNIEVLGTSQADGDAKANVVKQALSQDRFTLTITIDGSTASYDCEAADYREAFVTGRALARQRLIQFTVPNQPVPLSGGAY